MRVHTRLNGTLLTLILRVPPVVVVDMPPRVTPAAAEAAAVAADKETDEDQQLQSQAQARTSNRSALRVLTCRRDGLIVCMIVSARVRVSGLRSVWAGVFLIVTVVVVDGRSGCSSGGAMSGRGCHDRSAGVQEWSVK